MQAKLWQFLIFFFITVLIFLVTLRWLQRFSPKPDASPTPPSQPVRLLFGGDMMFDREIRLKIQKKGLDFIFEELKPLFLSYDTVIANLEGPVTTSPSRSVGSVPGSTNNFIFTFDPNIVQMLKENNITIVDLGNNHITNFGKNGVSQTKQFLQEGGIEFFGNSGLETTSDQRVLYKTFNETTIAFVSHNQFVNDGFETTLTDIQSARPRADIVIVMSHWGNEYQPQAKGVIVEQAHDFIDTGADLVIGAHPHVVQQSEDYNGKKIYYSLGNFVFDQYFSKETQQGLLVGVEVQPDGSMNFTEIPIQMSKTGQTTLQSKP